VQIAHPSPLFAPASTHAVDLVTKNMDGAIQAKTVTYDFERLMKAEGDATVKMSSAASSPTP